MEFMLVCPLDFRYGKPEMKNIFSEVNRLQKYLDVEASLARAQSKVGIIPEKDALKITQKASVKFVKIERVKEIETDIRHDLMAVVRALSEICGKSGKYIHFGATSYDIVDTAVALQIKEAITILEKDLKDLKKTLLKLAGNHKKTIMLGRTHGQFALPITFGLKISVFAYEIHRHIDRLKECKKRICVGKMSGAVGASAALGNKALKIQKLVMDDLNLGTEYAATQIVQRDRHIEFIGLLANIACSLEKFATEIRNLQRSEILEVAEAFDSKKQVGSSTMAHKKNPITCEKISGLARIIRGFMIPTFENSIQWHERDLANSSSDRFIIPHTVILTDEILKDMNNVFKNLAVYKDNMKRNLGRAELIMAESVMIELTKKGISRQDAHELVRKSSMLCESKKLSFKEVLSENGIINKTLTNDELNDALKPEKYIGKSVEVVEKIIKICS